PPRFKARQNRQVRPQALKCASSFSTQCSGDQTEDIESGFCLARLFVGAAARSWDGKCSSERSLVSHISRKTSEMWGTHVLWRGGFGRESQRPFTPFQLHSLPFFSPFSQAPA